MTQSILQSIDLEKPINCPRWEESKDHHACQGCRMEDICKAAHNEVGQ